MLRFLYGTIVLLVAASFWVYVYFFDGLSANSKQLEQEISQYKRDLIVSKQTIGKKDARIVEVEASAEESKSKFEEFQKSITEIEERLNKAVEEKEALSKQNEELQIKLAGLEARIEEEKNRADTLEDLNANMARSLDDTLQEVRRLQTIIRTLSNN